VTDDVARALRQLRKGTAACKLESLTFTNIVEAVVCFANSAGGTVVLGIADDKPWPDALVGTGMSSETLRRAIFERTSPPLDVAVEPLTVEGTTLLTVTVPEGLEVYGTSTGRYCWRRGTDCPPMTADDVGRLREERRGDDWPARSARAGGTEVVDATALARARELLARVPSGGVATLARYGGLDDS